MKTKETIIGLKELRENTEEYISQVDKGRSFTIVRRSKPVFRITPVDVWGDEGEWETVADFRDITPHGVSLDDITRALKYLHEQDRKIS
ncbi:MAG: type II toxin-antitoxin system prevent-host-death family antitoxin [Parcubacteria group bacterium]|nr:type II toxin-antitoxin system prevent-host-death family antitoxin [Parcubacteria group bacterium]